jgi:hypothetical protein
VHVNTDKHGHEQERCCTPLPRCRLPSDFHDLSMPLARGHTHWQEAVTEAKKATDQPSRPPFCLPTTDSIRNSLEYRVVPAGDTRRQNVAATSSSHSS